MGFGPQGGCSLIDYFTVKDSGERKQFDSGMQRDTTEGKIDYTLALDGPMFKRYAEHLTKGAQKYAKRNWMQAAGQEEYERFLESFLRHAMQWLEGDRSEDHAAAMWFNINGAEYTRERILNEYKATSCPVPDPVEEVRSPLPGETFLTNGELCPVRTGYPMEGACLREKGHEGPHVVS